MGGAEVGIPHLSPILIATPTNWRSESLSPDVQAQIVGLHRDGINAADGWALFWYARNSLFFSQQMEGHKRCLLVIYAKPVDDPAYLSAILRKLGIECGSLTEMTSRRLHRQSVDKASRSACA